MSSSTLPQRHKQQNQFPWPSTASLNQDLAQDSTWSSGQCLYYYVILIRVANESFSGYIVPRSLLQLGKRLVSSEHKPWSAPTSALKLDLRLSGDASRLSLPSSLIFTFLIVLCLGLHRMKTRGSKDRKGMGWSRENSDQFSGK